MNTWTPDQTVIDSTIAKLKAGRLQPVTPTIGTTDQGQSLFYKGTVNGIAGQAGIGKSFLAALIAKQHLEQDHPVYYVDLESNVETLILRLADMGTPLEAISKNMHYLRPETSWQDGGQSLVDHTKNGRDVLVVIDSVGESLALEGINQNDDGPVAQWFQTMPTRLARQGCTVLLVDHVPKSADNQNGPIGSHRKTAAITGAQYVLVPGKSFSRHDDGYSTIKVVKDRYGNHARGHKVARLNVSRQGRDVTLTSQQETLTGTPEIESTHVSALTEIVRVLHANSPMTKTELENQFAASSPPKISGQNNSVRQFAASSPLSRSVVRNAIQYGIDTGTLQVTRGSRNSHIVALNPDSNLVRQFAASSPTSVGNDGNSVRQFATPLRGGNTADCPAPKIQDVYQCRNCGQSVLMNQEIQANKDSGLCGRCNTKQVEALP